MAIRIKNTRLCSSFFVMFLLLNVILYLYDDDMSETLIEFTEQCDDLDDFNDNDNVIIKNYEFDLDEKFTDIQGTKYSPSNEHEEAINRKFCGKSECKFLFTYLQPEQETKANMHFRSFVKLAKALDRTMVLTNVGHSRINACQNFTFGFYYNVKALRKMFPDVNFITQKDFQCWSKKRRIKPTTEHVKILPGRKIQSMKLVTPYPDLLKTKSCLNRFGFKMDDQTVFKQFYTGQRSLKSIKKQTKFSEFLINNLKTDVEILLTTHLVFYPLFPNISKPIPYSNHNFEEASKITNRIKPYVAIHWRMERAILDKLPECAEALVKKLQEIKESQGIQNVYLATDYPITGGTTQSQTFHLLTEKHHKAINLLNSTFNIHTWSSSKIFANLRNDEMIEKEFSGAGIPGIVDKLVCMDADYFLATPEGCGRAQSTYTTMIVNEREKSIELGAKPQLKNIVERW